MLHSLQNYTRVELVDRALVKGSLCVLGVCCIVVIMTHMQPSRWLYVCYSYVIRSAMRCVKALLTIAVSTLHYYTL
jgi:hypothetical protein